MTKAKKPVKRGKGGSSKVSADERRALFSAAYLSNNRNATKAALAAGFSEKSAASQGARLLKHVKVRALIDSNQQEALDKYKLGVDDVMRSIAQELRFDPGKIYNENGTLKSITELDEDTRMGLAGVEFMQIGSPDAPIFTRKLKWQTRSPGREQLIKILGLYEKDNEQSRPITKVVMVPPKKAADD